MMRIFDFTGEYKKQDFYQSYSWQWEDFTHMSGVNGFCDSESLAVLKERTGKTYRGIHYLDGGNYHYMSYVMTEKIEMPFTLVVIDHHTDMQPPAFEELLSCGCWVKRVLDDQPFAKEVILIGVADHLAASIGENYKDRVCVFSESRITMDHGWLKELSGRVHYPAYLSVDKDAFHPRQAFTDWDQGSMTLCEMEAVLEVIAGKQEILGMDVCGEAGRAERDGNEAGKAMGLNNNANRTLAELFVRAMSEGGRKS